MSERTRRSGQDRAGSDPGVNPGRETEIVDRPCQGGLLGPGMSEKVSRRAVEGSERGVKRVLTG